MTRVATVLTTMLAAVAFGLAFDRVSAAGSPGAVYTASNSASGNMVIVFDRLANGALVPAFNVPTGGLGTGSGLGNQGGLTLSRNERWLLVVNAGSDTVSVFEVRQNGLALRDVEPSGGAQPISVAEHHGLVYVLNAGGDNISGFTLGADGTLSPLIGSARPLSAAGAGPAQVAFSPDGRVLLVTEKNTNRLVSFPIDRDGLPEPAHVRASAGATPFGFSFGKRDQVFVSEAFGGAVDASAASSYRVDANGSLTTISASVGTTETAACWLIVTPSGRFAYVTNTGSGSISGYAIDVDGKLALLNQDGRTALTGAGSSPIDLAFTPSGQFLYSLNGGTSTISAFLTLADGSLVPLATIGGLPPGANGLAAR